MGTNQALQRTKRTNGYSNNAGNSKEAVEKLAYQYYVDRGCQHGYDREDWLKAEAVVREQSGR